MAPRSPILDAFVRLNPSTYLHQPSSTAAVSANLIDSAPDTIILLSWSGASLHHVAKYASGYVRQCPTARIVLIMAEFEDFLYRTQTFQLRQLQPAVNVLLATPPRSRFLVHLFSNGGCHKLCQLSRAYKQATGNPIPIRLLVLDSGPGKATHGYSIAALSQPLPQTWPLRVAGTALLHVMLAGLWTFNAVTGTQDTVEGVRQDLNDPEKMDLKGDRCYVYSKCDEMVGWEHVLEHADEAREQGWTVRTELFTGKHAAHIRVDEKRYWDVVWSSWQAG